MKSFIRSFRLAAEIFSPGLLIVVVLTTQYIANPVGSEKKAEAAGSEKKQLFYSSVPKAGFSQVSNHFLNHKNQISLTINTYQL